MNQFSENRSFSQSGWCARLAGVLGRSLSAGHPSYQISAYLQQLIGVAAFCLESSLGARPLDVC
jgi:hypothetical protein